MADKLMRTPRHQFDIGLSVFDKTANLLSDLSLIYYLKTFFEIYHDFMKVY